MAESLTESFCERCGTRYTFETPINRSGRLSGVRVLGKGLRKLALTRAASLDEALESARADDEREASERQLEAFHDTFHFCLSCRQYTCTTCWNETAGACLGCEPTPESLAADRLAAEQEAAERAEAERLAAARAAAERAAAERQAAERAAREQAAAARAATERAAAARVAAVKAAAQRSAARRRASTRETPAALPEAAPAVPELPASVDETAVSPFAAIQASEASAAWTAPPDPSAVRPTPAAIAASGDFDRLAPGTSLDDAIAAYEAALGTEDRGVEGAPAPTPAPIAVEAALVEAVALEEPTDGPIAEIAAVAPPAEAPGAGLERQDVTLQDALIRQAVEAALSQPMPRPRRPEALEIIAAAEQEAADLAADALEIVAAPELAAESLEAAAEVAAPEHAAEPLDVAAEDDAPDLAAEPLVPAEILDRPPQVDPRLAAWRIVAPEPFVPSAPLRPGAMPVPTAALAGVGAAAGSSTPGRASAPATGSAAQTCIQCGLSLSATARFCRRCGTRQG